MMARKISAVFMTAALLVPLASPAGAVEATADAKVTVFDLKESGSSQLRVREYDGREPKDGLEADLSVRSAFDKLLIDLRGSDLNSGSDKAGIDVHVGPWVRLEGDLGVLTHRQALTEEGNVINGMWIGQIYGGTQGWASFRTLTPNHLGVTDNLQFRRTATKGRLVLRDLKCPAWLTLGWWREAEDGARPHYYYAGNMSRVARQDMNRYTRDVSLALESKLGQEGYAGYEVTTRKFAESAPTAVDASIAGNYGDLPRRMLNWYSDQAMLKHTLAGSYRFSPNLTVAAGASTRNRKHFLTQYSMTANSAHAAAAYRPSKNWSLTGRLYGRATKTNENTASAQYRMAGNDAGDDSVDYYSYNGDLRARYTGFKAVALSLGYKPEHTFRRNAGDFTERATFANQAIYQDGQVHEAGGVENATEATDTRHTVTANAAVALPGDASVSLGLQEMAANRGGYQAMPTRMSNQTVSLEVPVGQEGQLSATGGFTYAANQKASFARFKRRSTWTQLGAVWTDGQDRGSIGAFYGYEFRKDQYDAFWGDATQGAGNNPIVHVLMPYRQENHTFSTTASAKLPKSLRVDGDASYAFVNGHNPTGGAFNNQIQGGVDFSDYNPTDIANLNWGVGLTYAPSKDLSTRLGYRQDVWFDNYLVANNGQARFVSLSATAKF